MNELSNISINNSSSSPLKNHNDFKEFEFPKCIDFIRIVLMNIKNFRQSKIFYCLNEIGESINIIVEDDWFNVEVSVGSILNLVYLASTCYAPKIPFNENWKEELLEFVDDNLYFRVNNFSSLVIISNPDILLAATKVSESFPCSRNSIVTEKFKSFSNSKPALNGTMAHELVQKVMKFSMENIDIFVEEVINDHIEDIYSINETELTCRDFLTSIITNIKLWYTNYFIAQNNPAVTLKCFNGKSPILLAGVSSIVGIEENIWSVALGLRAVLDAIVTVRDSTSLVEYLCPLEIKTGKSISISHHAQLDLYTLMLSDRFGLSIYSGLLLHLPKPNDFSMHFPSPLILRQLLLKRNELAFYLNQTLNQDILNSNDINLYPPMLNDDNVCNKCYSVNACTFIHKTIEQGTLQSSGINSQTWYSKTDRLLNSDKLYFAKWDNLIDREYLEELKALSLMWIKDAEDLQRDGKCLCKLRIFNIDGLLVVFERNIVGIPFAETSFKLNDYIYLSIDSKYSKSGSFALFSGVVTVINHDTIGVTLDKKLILLASKNLDDRLTNINSNVLWRLDKREYISGFSIAKANLSSLFVGVSGVSSTAAELNTASNIVDIEDLCISKLNDNFLIKSDKHIFNSLDESSDSELDLLNSSPSKKAGGAAFDEIGDFKRRKLIVRLTEPRFSKFPFLASKFSNPNSNITSMLKSLGNNLFEDFLNLNTFQQAAIEKCLSAHDYTLWLGMPGTGKTTTIVYLIRILVSCGRRVLLTSYTHSSVDNILLKLLNFPDCTSKMMRISTSDNAVHPQIKSFVLKKGKPAETEISCGLYFNTVSELDEIIKNKNIVASTCLGVRHFLFSCNLIEFDLCIIDEASQLTEPVCIGPLKYANSFLLVGDHYQLPPLVKSTTCKESGMSISLFRKLCEFHPSALSPLVSQYRMCSEISSLANYLTYNDQLIPSTLGIARQKLHDLNFEDLALMVEKDLGNGAITKEFYSFLKVLDANSPVNFINTDLIFADEIGDILSLETKQNTIIINSVEAILVSFLVELLISIGITCNRIGIIVPYRGQFRLLNHIFDNRFPGLTIYTIDQMQGRDTDVLIFSCVRSNTLGQCGDLLCEWRRVNVALTRPKQKLIIIGSVRTVSNAPPFQGVLDLISGHILQCPSNFKTSFQSHPNFNECVNNVAKILNSLTNEKNDL